MNEWLTRHIILIGMPGAGKTTIGRQLAKRLGRQFIDIDHEIEARTGVRIPLIFEYEGEEGFRDRESSVLSDLTDGSPSVIATGGGVILRESNRQLMKQSGVCIYLSATPGLLYERTKHDKNRPLLQVANPLLRLDEIFQVRDPLYREIADIVIIAGTGGAGAIVRKIEKDLESKCAV